MAYATLAELKSYTGVTGTSEDTLLNSLLAAVTAFVELKTGRAWGADVLVTDEVHDLAPRVYLRNMDIKSVQNVTVGRDSPQTLDAADYYFNSFGRLVLSHVPGHVERPGDFDALKVSYTYNAGAVPADIKHAVLEIAAKLYDRRSGGQITGESVGSYNVQHADAGEMDAVLRRHPDLLGIINGHRRVRI